MSTNGSATKIALVTGANKGIGKEIARQLGGQGMTVLVGARDEARGAEAVSELRAADVDAHFVQIDVTKEESIAAAAKRIGDDYGHLDILVNNAGILIDDTAPSAVAMESVRRTYETNVLGLIAVTQVMLPLLKKAEAGRIVNMSSGLGSIATALMPDSPTASINLLAYNSSKSAVNSITAQFAIELRDTPIKINAVCPGSVGTELNPAGPRSVEQGAAEPVRLATLPSDGPTGGYTNEDGPIPW